MRVNKNELKKVGVTLTNPDRIIVHCDACGQGWSPNILPGGKLKKRWWVCPRECNDPRRKQR